MALRCSVHSRFLLCLFTLLVIPVGVQAFSENPQSASAAVVSIVTEQEAAPSPQSISDSTSKSQRNLETSEDWNRRLKQIMEADLAAHTVSPSEYRIGPDDVLDISVFAAQELNRQVRVSASGEISLPLLGGVRAAGLTPRELEVVLQELLHRTYMKDPHVSVFVRDMQSHPVSVMGAVRKPGVFQVRGPKTLLEVLSLAEGLSDDAGETAIIMRGAGLSGESASITESSSAMSESASSPSISAASNDGEASGYVSASNKSVLAPNKNAQSSETVIDANLKDLLGSSDPANNPLVYPGDIVKVTRAGVVYVVGEVRKPGGFTLKSNEGISVLQAIALSEGLTHTAAKSAARIIRTDQQSGARTETPIDLGKIMTGKAPDPMLGPRDIVFIPDSAAKTTFSRGVEVATQTLTGLLIFHW